MGDNTVKIFLNAKGKENDVSSDLLAFLNYINGKKSENPLVEALDNGVQFVKKNKEWRNDFMRYQEHIAAEAHLQALEIAQDMAEKAAKEAAEKARKEAEEKKTIEMIKNFLVAGASTELIQKATGWSEQQILSLKM